jgi:acyl carrier protein
MGLEEVELVMDLEDEFGIDISDSIAQEMRTVGQMYDAILPIVRSNGKDAIRSRADLESFVWMRVRQLAAKHALDVEPPEITRETRFTEDLGYG